MMKRKMLSFLAVFFPWVILLIDDNPGGALLALIMQATAIGWIPASMWAWRIVHDKENKGKGKKMEQQENSD
jgi:hypothetical protein